MKNMEITQVCRELSEMRDKDFVQRVHGMLRKHEVDEVEISVFVVNELIRRSRELHKELG